MTCIGESTGQWRERAALYRELNREARLGLGAMLLILLCTSVLAVLLLAGGVLGEASLLIRFSLAIAPLLLALKLAGWLLAVAPLPVGIPLAEGEAVQFRRVVARLCAQLKVPMVHRLLISDEMNAAVVTRPRHGLWGPMESVLVVGLPLLQSVNPRQLKAILAHEVAHLGRQRLGEKAWAAHFRAWWLRVVDRIDTAPDPVSRLVAVPLRPVTDRFVLSLLKLSHLEEFEADAVAADMVGAEALAEALIEVALKARMLYEASPTGRPAAEAEADARSGDFADASLSGAAVGLRELRGALCTAALLDEPGPQLHPALGDRLAALQVGLHSLIEDAPSAAQCYFRQCLPSLLGRFAPSRHLPLV